MALPQRARLYAHTLRHLRPWQVTGRLVARARQALPPALGPEPPAGLHGALHPRVPLPHHDPENTAEAVAEGRFSFLDDARSLGRPVRWAPREAPLLWQFHLHYFGYLHLLPRSEQEALCREWVAANPPGRQPAWHPYTTSLRIINWCKAGFDDPALLRSLYRQAAFLARNLETHVMGNHLLENARALVYAGCFFEGQGEAGHWLEEGVRIYREQTPEQVLPDGGHFERSPMYHALVLEGYLDVLNLLPNGHPAEAELRGAAARMQDFHAALTHPDGQIALLNDAVQDGALAPVDLARYAAAVLQREPEARTAFPETGYFVHRGGAAYLAFDAGPAGPDHLLAHAHADLLSLELSLGGHQLITDRGVFEYAPGPTRDFDRSTAAHNTVTVDGTDQIECWDSFRVARRFRPRQVRFEQEGRRSTFEGSFFGYAGLLGDGIMHRRRVVVDEAERAVFIRDAVGGRGVHRAESRLHLHPDVVVAREGEGLTLRRAGQEIHLAGEGGALSVEEGGYCPTFGVEHPRAVVRLLHDGPLPARLGFTLRF